MGGVLILVALAIYFAPFIMAICRDHASLGTLLVVNLLLGWTVVGWIVALIWAASGQSTRDRQEQREANRAMIALARKER